MLTSIRVRGYRCLRDVSVNLEPLTVFIGKNDTGKTSLLEAIHTLGRLVAGQQDAMRGPWSVTNSLTSGAKEISWDVTIGATPLNGLPGQATYSLTVAQGEKGNPRIVREDCEIEGSPAALHMFQDDVMPTVKIGDAVRHQGALLKPAIGHLPAQDEKLLRGVARAITSSVLYRFDPKELAGEASIGNDETEPRMRYDGAKLAAVLDYLVGVDRKAFDALEQDLRSAAPHIRNVLIKPAAVGPKRRPGKSLWFAVEPTGHHIPAQLASDGILLFLAYLALVYAPTAPATILLEEPENGVHPRRLPEIASFLSRLSDAERGARRAQVLLATHSPYFLDHIAPECVRVFGRDESGGTTARPLLELPKVRERLAGGLSLGEMWFNVGEDRLLGGPTNGEREVDAASAGE